MSKKTTSEQSLKIPKTKVSARTTKTKISLTPLNQTQSDIIHAILENTVTIIYGCAGSGKTHIPTILGLSEILNYNKYSKLILTRPCVEAFGEKLGFLPGDYREKLEPYMIPMFNILKNYVAEDYLNNLLNKDIIETIPIAFLRGVTFNDSFVVIDEAQNTTIEQMRLVMTRLGVGSKMVITGDPNQVDRPGASNNGLTDAVDRFSGCDNVAIIKTETHSIVRDPLVQEIEQRYNNI